MSMNVTDKRIDQGVNLELSGLGAGATDLTENAAKGVALGPVINGVNVQVVLPVDLQAMLEKMGIEREDQRRDLLAMKLSSALAMMLGSMQIFNQQQQAVLDGIAKCEEAIKLIKGGTMPGPEEAAALAELGVAIDPTIVAVQIEIEKLNQMIESLKETPEEKRTEEQNKQLKEKEKEKADLEKTLKAKTDNLISQIKAAEAEKLFSQLNSDCISAIFSALSVVAALARKELAESPDNKDLALLLDGAEQLAIALGAACSDELREFNEMMTQLNASRVQMA